MVIMQWPVCVCVCAHMDRAISLSRILVAICYPLPFWVCVNVCLFIFVGVLLMFLWPMHIISYVVFASVLQYNWGISWRTWQDLRDFPFASCTDVFCGGPIPGESPSWTVFENWCEYTYSLYSVRTRSWPNEDPTDSTCSQPFSDKFFSNWNLAFSSFSFLVLTNQHWVSGISRQKKWSHVSAFQTFEHCGCFQHCCPNEHPVFVIWAILGWHWWPQSYLQHLLRCYFQELRCCGESKCIFSFGRKCFFFYFIIGKFPLNQ